MNYCYKLSCIEWKHGLFGNIYENAMLSKSYPIVVTGIININPKFAIDRIIYIPKLPKRVK